MTYFILDKNRLFWFRQKIRISSKIIFLRKRNPRSRKGDDNFRNLKFESNADFKINVFNNGDKLDRERDRVNFPYFEESVFSNVKNWNDISKWEQILVEISGNRVRGLQGSVFHWSCYQFESAPAGQWVSNEKCPVQSNRRELGSLRIGVLVYSRIFNRLSWSLASTLHFSLHGL